MRLEQGRRAYFDAEGNALPVMSSSNNTSVRSIELTTNDDRSATITSFAAGLPTPTAALDTGLPPA